MTSQADVDALVEAIRASTRRINALTLSLAVDSDMAALNQRAHRVLAAGKPPVIGAEA